MSPFLEYKSVIVKNYDILFWILPPLLFSIFLKLESSPCVATDVTNHKTDVANHKTFKLISKQPIQLLRTKLRQELVVVS
jgi:hypothetical protein